MFLHSHSHSLGCISDISVSFCQIFKCQKVLHSLEILWCIPLGEGTWPWHPLRDPPLDTVAFLFQVIFIYSLSIFGICGTRLLLRYFGICGTRLLLLCAVDRRAPF